MATFPTPLHKGRSALISSGYGQRNGRLHAGVDLTFKLVPGDKPLIDEYTVSGSFFHPIGLPALAAMPGRVSYAHVTQTGGYIRVDHSNGVETEYIHLKPGSFRVKVGDIVYEGQPLAEISGNIITGKPGLIHLHFQYRKNGSTMDPASIMKTWKRVKNPWEIDLLLVLTLAAGAYILV